MTIEDQIKDEKLQYDINREAAKISALSSDKIDKYEYLTGEDKLLLSKERKIFKDIYNKRLDKIEEINNKIDYNNLKYVVVGTGDEYDFNNLDDALTFLNNIKKGKISMNKAIEQQEKFYKYLNIIRIGNKNENQKKVLANAYILFNGRNSAIKFIEDYGSMILEAKRLAKEEQEGKGLKILTPNQMLKRLPIALALVKAGNNSESLLNEIRQIVYSLYRSKEITKKVYNNIINSIKV